MKSFSIAIDGPAAAGKSTVAKRVAKFFNCTYIDTGAMYRAVTYYALINKIDPNCEEDVVRTLDKINIVLNSDDTILLNGEDVTKQIRTSEVAQNVSAVSTYKTVRLHLVKLQRAMAKSVSVVMDGRDIGTYVLPHADVKIFQVASVETRAKRRYLENLEKGIDCKLEQIEAELRRRDFLDSTRAFAPLKEAVDAIRIDTSDLSIEEAVEEVIKCVKAKIGNKYE